jgi:hypothetical protein
VILERAQTIPPRVLFDTGTDAPHGRIVPTTLPVSVKYIESAVGVAHLGINASFGAINSEENKDEDPLAPMRLLFEPKAREQSLVAAGSGPGQVHAAILG